MTISLVVAASDNHVIGRDNQLLWHLPDDLKFFKNVTWAMPVVMGRKTFDSIGRKPLPGRWNIVISRQHGDSIPGKLSWVRSLDEALQAAAREHYREVMIAGGAQVYEQAMPLADRIYMTRVHAELEGDAFFPVIDQQLFERVKAQPGKLDEKHAYGHTFEVWERKSSNGHQ